jgi:hypothetical protein
MELGHAACRAVGLGTAHLMPKDLLAVIEEPPAPPTAQSG